MRKVILFIGMSLDGYIADQEGGVDWMSGQTEGHFEEDMQSYQEFIKGIDTVLLGWNTYDQIAHELSPEKWMYDEFQSYVITHHDAVSTQNIVFTKQNPCALIHDLQQKEGKDIWICGGANLVNQLLQADLIDCFYISVLPTILGAGIPLFQALQQEKKLKLIHSKSYDGITDLVYERR